MGKMAKAVAEGTMGILGKMIQALDFLFLRLARIGVNADQSQRGWMATLLLSMWFAAALVALCNVIGYRIFDADLESMYRSWWSTGPGRYWGGKSQAYVFFFAFLVPSYVAANRIGRRCIRFIGPPGAAKDHIIFAAGYCALIGLFLLGLSKVWSLIALIAHALFFIVLMFLSSREVANRETSL
jgi:hypothetical protein